MPRELSFKNQMYREVHSAELTALNRIEYMLLNGATINDVLKWIQPRTEFLKARLDAIAKLERE